jgi:carotenoid cleavage dioxygenase-like enzyme
VKYDAVTGAKTQWQSGPNGHVGEAVFAPDPDGSAEDDGWLLTLVWNHSTDETDLCVIDARDVAAGPVARIHAPERVSFGFHVNWFAGA